MILKDLRMLKTQFTMNLAYAGKGGEELGTELSLEAFDQNGSQEKVIMMKIRSKGDNLPYEFEIVYGVKFEVTEEEMRNDIDRICTVNMPAIVFPYLREFIADLTRRSGHPPLLLQPINFVKAAEGAVIEKD